MEFEHAMAQKKDRLMKKISLDFETYSENDIRKSGAYAYACHSTTEVLCLAWALDGEKPTLWLPSMPLPQKLFNLISEGAVLWAWNAPFEMAIWSHVLKWPNLPINQWRDTAALAAAQAYPRALSKCGEALGLSGDAAKDKRGKLLIQRCCKPYRGERVRDPVLYKELYEYCLQDVVAEREIRHRLRNLRGIENDIWETDQLINWRGVRLDRTSIENAIFVIEQHTQKLNKRVFKLTDGFVDSTSSRAKAMLWTAKRGYPLPSYDKSAIVAALADPKCPDEVKCFLEIRQSLSKSSTKKYAAMLQCLAPDDRVHQTLLYHGASTGRWAGRHLQPHNLPRPTIADSDISTAIVQLANRDSESIVGEPMDTLSSCLRAMLIASPDCRFIAADYSSIEARVLAWLAGHDEVLNTFRSGKDIYKATASTMYNVGYEQVTSSQRFVGKVATLALGYQGGVRAFQKMSEVYGATVSEVQALRIRNDWREANAPIVKMWARTERAARNAISYSTEHAAAGGAFKVVRGDLLFKLPSGRLLSFPDAKLQDGDRGLDIVYSGMNNHTHRWEQIKAYGGSFVQSITQAVARDILAEAILRLEATGYPIVLHVHDEIVADVSKSHGSLSEFEKLMCVLPEWAKGLPVSAEGYESTRYKK